MFGWCLTFIWLYIRLHIAMLICLVTVKLEIYGLDWDYIFFNTYCETAKTAVGSLLPMRWAPNSYMYYCFLVMLNTVLLCSVTSWLLIWPNWIQLIWVKQPYILYRDLTFAANMLCDMCACARVCVRVCLCLYFKCVICVILHVDWKASGLKSERVRLQFG